MPEVYDFEGWATKNDLKCEDGLVIRKDAFKLNDGRKVPLVYNHDHTSIQSVLGHAMLENRKDGIYAYCKFNDTPAGKAAKETVKHGDIVSLSIFANQLKKIGTDVIHGMIREVSLVLAGANPGAFIESVMAHNMPMDIDDEEGIIYTGEPIVLCHSSEGKKEEETTMEGKPADGSGGSKTVGDVFNSFTEEQKKAVAILVSQAIADEKGEGSEPEPKKEEGGEKMQHNAFEGQEGKDGKDVQVLSHSVMQKIFKDAKSCGSLREAVHNNLEDGVLMHSIDTTGMTTATGNQTYGFNDPEMLFPEYRSLNNPPEWISRNMDWVSKVMAQVSRTPFSRIKSVYADITADEARARGYMKTKLKKEEVFTILKRTTDPQTIYKKQKLDRDDVVDIVDFDVVAWIRAEMRVMLNEEIARAILIGDGRPTDSEDKIKEDHIRPVVKDVPLFNITVMVPKNADENFYETFIDEIIRSRKEYKGSGNPTFWTTDDVTTEMLLLKDKIGQRLYKTETELATTLRVSSIVPVEPMAGMTINVKGKNHKLLGVVVNLKDYNVGADKGGAINMFDDFDIDYNQMKYLIETRISGALVKPFSAITFVEAEETTEAVG